MEHKVPTSSTNTYIHTHYRERFRNVTYIYIMIIVSFINCIIASVVLEPAPTSMP